MLVSLWTVMLKRTKLYNEFTFVLLFRVMTLLNVLALLAIDYRFNVSKGKIIWVLFLAFLWAMQLHQRRDSIHAVITKSYAFITLDIFMAFIFIGYTGGWNSPFYLYSFGPIMLASFIIILEAV